MQTITTIGLEMRSEAVGAEQMRRDEKNDNLTESWRCIDCGVNTAPGLLGGADLRNALANAPDGKVDQSVGDDTEVYTVRKVVWAEARMEDRRGCLCIGCLEKRLGRRLRPKDFDDHVFNTMPGTPRLLSRRLVCPDLEPGLGRGQYCRPYGRCIGKLLIV
jgi:hypothetical protein